MKNIIKGEKVDILRRIFAVCGGDIFDNDIRDFLKLLLVVPKLFKELNEVLRVFKAFRLLHRIVSVVPAFATEVDRCKAVDRHIGAFFACTALQKVNYAGNMTDWENIIIADENEPLIQAQITYNYIPST